VEVVVMLADKVKVAIQVRDDEGELCPREWLWATVVYEDKRKGIYCLLNTPFFAPFALGDLVEARFRRDGERMVTALHRRGGRTAHMLMFCAAVDREAIRRLARRWEESGTWVEGLDGIALTIAVERETGGQPAEAELAELAASGRLQAINQLADPNQQPDDPIFRYVVAA
jgi:Domain of unknown function (DUF4265)